MNIINNYLTQIILTIFLAVAALLGNQVKKLYAKYVTTDIKRAVCRTVVRFVEQVYIDLHGRDKLEMAMKRASLLLEDYGITISDQELITLLEAAVNEFNNTFCKDAAAEPPDVTE